MGHGPAVRTKQDVVSEFRESEIIDAARRVIVQHGLANASMEKIADAANISKGTLYLYFDSKEALVREATERGHAALAEAVAAATEAATAPVDALHAYVRAVIAFSDENAVMFRAMDMHPDSAGAPAAKAVEKRIGAYVDLLEGFLDQGMADGSIRPVRPRQVARILVEAVRGIVIERLREASPRPVDEDATALVDVVLNGIGGAGRSARP